MTPARDPGRPDAQTVTGAGGAKAHVPLRALLISVAALTIPLVATTLTPELVDQQYALIIWLPALLPAFLLTYYRGWGGASAALAAGMATLALSQAVMSGMRAQPPRWPFLMVMVLVWVAICFAVGWFGELLHRARRHAEEVALRDPLTGLPNRGHLRLFLDTAFGSAERGGHLTVVIFDLDHFKRVNDVHGHAAGDRTLVAFADLLRTHTRRSDLSARFGGEEFVSILTGPGGAAGAKVFADRVREAVAALPFEWAPQTVSAGIAEYQTQMSSPDLVLAAADRALYQAKAEGRNRIVVADEGGRTESPEAVEAEVVEEVPPEAREARGIERGGFAKKGGPKVLIVDDDEIMAEGVAGILKRAGFRTLKAKDGQEALERIKAGAAPDLVLSDVVMPAMSGLTLAERLRESQPGTRVLLMSGYEHEKQSMDLPSPVVRLMKKPLTPPALVAAVQAALQAAPSGATVPLEQGPPPTNLAPATGARRER